ncbi:hypothetical protein [Nocardia otitidiscaviarum]|uniref:hypothetical protein n=1 Tax=Nocardia otitidiscaviarum TaxID=1823 RepID=UPI0004A77DC2|nr:hypothetical protein [Nocardia otitidiscaviarum]
MSAYDHDEAREIADIASGDARLALVHATLEVARYTAMLVDQQRLANAIALLNPELATSEHVDEGEIIARVRADLFGGEA